MKRMEIKINVDVENLCKNGREENASEQRTQIGGTNSRERRKRKMKRKIRART